MRKDTIIFISDGKSYLDDSILDNLSDVGFKVVRSTPTEDSLTKALVTRPKAALVFIDEGMLRGGSKLHVITDCLEQSEIQIFLLGQKEEVENVQKIIPPHLVGQVFIRPIDVKTVAVGIRTFVDRFGMSIKRSILVVDDSGSYLRSVQEWLGNDYEIILASSATMAIKALTLKRPDLVLLDYEMPVVDGKHVLEMIRSESEFSGIPVVFLTGKDDWESVMDVMPLKPEGYLLKTMPPEEIRKSIEEVFEKGNLYGK